MAKLFLYSLCQEQSSVIYSACRKKLIFILKRHLEDIVKDSFPSHYQNLQYDSEPDPVCRGAVKLSAA